MAVDVQRARQAAPFLIASCTVRPRFTANSGLAGTFSLAALDVEIGAQRAAKIHAGGQGIGRQRPWLRPGRGAPWRGVIDEARERRVGAIVLQHDRRDAARLQHGIDEQIGAIAGRERDPSLARPERLGRLAVDRHHGHRMTIDAQRHEAVRRH